MNGEQGHGGAGEGEWARAPAADWPSPARAKNEIGTHRTLALAISSRSALFCMGILICKARATGATAAGQTLRMSPRTPESRRPRPLARPGELTTAIDNDVIIQ